MPDALIESLQAVMDAYKTVNPITLMIVSLDGDGVQRLVSNGAPMTTRLYTFLKAYAIAHQTQRLMMVMRQDLVIDGDSRPAKYQTRHECLEIHDFRPGEARAYFLSVIRVDGVFKKFGDPVPPEEDAHLPILIPLVPPTPEEVEEACCRAASLAMA